MHLYKFSLLLFSAPLWFSGCELSPIDTARLLPEGNRPGTPDTLALKPQEILKPGAPIRVDTVRANPPVPVDTVLLPPRPVDTLIPPVSVDTLLPTIPVDTSKPPVPIDTLKPPVPITIIKPSVPKDSSDPKPTGSLSVLKSDLEDQSASCWGSRNGSGYALASCGIWKGIGGNGARLAEGQTRRSGNKSLALTFVKNEDVAGASLPVHGEVINVRAWYQFATGFDFGQGVKIGRISSFNSKTQMNDIDIILTARSSGSADQCGLTDMSDMGLFFNGRPVGYDWGNITANREFERGRWYAIEYQVALNTPGKRDGSVKIWIDGTLAASKTGINIRGNGGSEVKLNTLRIGGWYSNSANGNGCSSPSQPSTLYVDDVAVGGGYIGTD